MKDEPIPTRIETAHYSDMLNYALHAAFWLVLAVFVAYFVMRLPGQ